MPDGTRVVEFAAADRVHMKSTSKIGVDVEAITIGDKHYWYSGGKWTEGSLDLASNGGADFAKKVAEMLKDVKYVGPETVNGIECHLYSCTIDGSMGGQNWTGTAKIWIGAADGLPHQSDSDFKVANSFGGKSHIVYEYGGKIKVEPPVLTMILEGGFKKRVGKSLFSCFPPVRFFGGCLGNQTRPAPHSPPGPGDHRMKRKRP